MATLIVQHISHKFLLCFAGRTDGDRVPSAIDGLTSPFPTLQLQQLQQQLQHHHSLLFSPRNQQVDLSPQMPRAPQASTPTITPQLTPQLPHQHLQNEQQLQNHQLALHHQQQMLGHSNLLGEYPAMFFFCCLRLTFLSTSHGENNELKRQNLPLM